MGGSGDAPAKTAEQLAIERRQRNVLNEEIEASETRLKAMAQKKIGKKSLFAPSFGPNNPRPGKDTPGSMLGVQSPAYDRSKEVELSRQGNRGATAAARAQGRTAKIDMSRNDPRRGNR
jgi:hypothetical protein